MALVPDATPTKNIDGFRGICADFTEFAVQEEGLKNLCFFT